MNVRGNAGRCLRVQLGAFTVGIYYLAAAALQLSAALVARPFPG